LADIPLGLPAGCESGVLRELIEARPAVVAKHALAESSRLRGYRAETIRKSLAGLVERELVREWNGSRFGNVVILSELAAERFGLELMQATISGDLSDTIDLAFAGCRWVAIARPEESPHAQVRQRPAPRRQASQRRPRRLCRPGHDE
jgi:hypothetical protein